MERNTISLTVQSGLCCGCGVCKAMCPKECISWNKEHGAFLPLIDAQVCVNCGLCASVCPGLGHTYEAKGTAVETVTGPVLQCFNAWSLDPELRHVSASGGVVSTIIRELLTQGIYDGAFCLDSYDYHSQLKTRLYTAGEVSACRGKSSAPKSRYLPVSHENAVAYMKEHRNARLIFVGTSCAVRGMQAAMNKLRLDRSQYLFIGLFCDKVFNYNVLPYFEDTYSQGGTVQALHFKNKESGGWPGDMKFYPEEGEPFYVPLAERAKAKAYFMPERCLYCVDKLNVCADISLGDNYTGKDSSELGSNSVIIRTETGARVWLLVQSNLEVRFTSIEDIQNAQYLEGRLNNLYFSMLKSNSLDQVLDLNGGIPREQEFGDFRRAWSTSIQRLQAGAVYDTEPMKLNKQIQKDSKKPGTVLNFIKRCYYFVKRKAMK